MTDVLRRHTEGERHVRTETEITGTPGMVGAPGSRKRQEGPYPRALEECSPADILTLDFWPPAL